MALAPLFSPSPAKPIIIAGPCMAESPELLEAVATSLLALAKELNFDLIFKASFDKANRTSINSYRGPGLDQCKLWFADLKSRYGLRILTDVHETSQCASAAEVCDVLQIPAFLCRQTDLIIAAAKTGRSVNVKKGQFISPEAIPHITKKLKEVAAVEKLPLDFALTERGVTFGYGNLVVDMRHLKTMAAQGGGVIFDITHSLQLPATGGASGEFTGGAREFAPLLARAAVATGYLTGLFLEVHTQPAKALSDATTQLSISQAEKLLRQVIPMWYQTKQATSIDSSF